MLRSRMYEGRSLEKGRVVEVDDNFARWLIGRRMAVPYTVSFIPEAMKRRGRPPKGD
jgi:hypothetical protein